jgi:hypothetical protein
MNAHKTGQHREGVCPNVIDRRKIVSPIRIQHRNNEDKASSKPLARLGTHLAP